MLNNIGRKGVLMSHFLGVFKCLIVTSFCNGL